LKKILISTGGSGGHVVPALSLYEHLQVNFDVTLYTDSRGAKFIPKEIKKTVFEVKNIPEKKYLLPIKLIVLFFSFLKSIIHLGRHKYDIVISTGGYMSLPIVLASKLFDKKIFLFEPNSIIGRSNKFLLKFSTKIFCYDKNIKGLNKKYLDKLIEIPPILNKCFYRNNNSSEIGEKTIKILVIGGSQASIFFSKNLKNEIIKLASKYTIKINQQISRSLNIDNYKKDYERHNIENNLFFFEENILCKKNNFDIAISRAGASSLAELAHLNIPFIAVPFPHATDNHQLINAKRYSDLNSCWILEEKNFNSGDIYKIINQIMVNRDEYFEKKSNLKKINKNKSWDEINEKIKDILNDN
tara:strand:- start:11068 stop:12138 length:1071 start_codon:yes stop_codon:yes gene_type:complete